MSYFSTILTATKSRYQTLRGIDERDGDTEDDSHIARVLRTYYTEQNRPLPDWLGGGPQRHHPQHPQHPQQAPQNLRNNYGAHQRPGPGNATLSDIWDSPPAQAGARPAFGIRQQPALFLDNEQSGNDNAGNTGRNAGGNAGGNTGGVAMTAQQRIKERLWGGRTASPPPNKTTPPPPTSVQMPLPPSFGGRPAGYRPLAQHRGGGGGEGGGRPHVQAGMPWDNGRHSAGGGGGYSDGYDGSAVFNPGFTPAGGPGGGGAQGSGGNLRRGKLGVGMGLPSGPGMMRQQGGHRGEY